MSTSTATPPTANLQPAPRLTIKQAAKLMNVSERLVYMVGRVKRLRPDLYERIKRGELSAHAATRIMDGPKPPDHFAALCLAWNRASEDDQARFLVILDQNPFRLTISSVAQVRSTLSG